MRDFRGNNDGKAKAACSNSMVERRCEESTYLCTRKTVRAAGGQETSPHFRRSRTEGDETGNSVPLNQAEKALAAPAIMGAAAIHVRPLELVSGSLVNSMVSWPSKTSSAHRRYTVLGVTWNWMDASVVGVNNLRNAARIPHRKIERRVWSIHSCDQVLRVRPRANCRAAHARPSLRLGCSTSGCGKADAMFQVWPQEMHHKSLSVAKAAWLFVLALLETDDRFRVSAPRMGLVLDALSACGSPRPRALERNHA